MHTRARLFASMRIVASVLVLLAGATYCHAQPPNDDCASAALLCAQQPLTGNNTGSTDPIPAFCQPGDFQVWYTFTTNSVGGPVDVSISGIDCPAIAGMDNELSAAVLSGDGSCLPASFTGSSCVRDSVDFSFTTLSLTANTQYWIVVAGVMNNGAIIPAQCGFQIAISGTGADVINVDFDAGPDVEISDGGSTQLNAVGGTTYDWSPTTGLSGNGIPDPIASPVSSTSYNVTTVIDGCTYTDVVFVEVRLLIQPPNTFSPNGDGINDLWEIPGIAEFPGSEVLIYDRWGQRMFRSNGYREPWDGTNNGRDVTTGTYYYHIQLNQLEGQSAPYTGFISLIR